VRFWDASATVPLLVAQASSGAVEAQVDTDGSLVVWWAMEVECASAIARLEREGAITAQQAAAALENLADMAASWQEVHHTARIRRVALRLLRVHPLRAGDALQLAAAIVAADGDPRSLPFVTLDDRLALAAEREGFPVVVPE
jgi:predicted nucleic acid-binding protein